jgi:hypothetical protein
MNPKGFRALLERPSWSKDVVVWVGNSDGLATLLGNTNPLELDLLDLFPPDEALPVSRADRADLLRRRLDKKLQELKPAGPQRTVLRVRNAPLLARYGVGLQAFYDWFGGSHTLAVLEINRTKAVRLPGQAADKVHFDPDWLVEYFRPLLAKPDNICAETE